jgi:uncharacterized protein with GYD domain
MATFFMSFSYTSGSWARMLKIADDRASAVSDLLQHLGGHLIGIYWGVESAQAYVIAELPDSMSATAAITVATETAAFKDVQVHEVHTQEQIRGVIALAKGAEGVYRPPGRAAIETEISLT